MLYELSMPERIKDGNIVYVLQELPGTKAGAPKINIMSASKYGKFKFLLPEFSQIIFSSSHVRNNRASHANNSGISC